MNARKAIPIYLVIISSQVFLSFGEDNSDCKLITPSDKEKYHLQQLKPISGVRFSAFDESSKEKYTYYLGICTPAKDGDEFKESGMVQIGQPNITKTLGKFTQTQVYGGDGWILLKYEKGDLYHSRCRLNNSTYQARQALIMITCGSELKGKLTVIEENLDPGEECYYLFQLESSVACTPNAPKEGLSSGSIFCIVVLTAFGLYLIVGFLHQRIVVGAKGLEQIPNYNMWKEFGKLQAEGCDFLCRCGERAEAKKYRGVDDQLLNPENRDERDDRLLPM